MGRFVLRQKNPKVWQCLDELCDEDKWYTIFLFFIGRSGSKNYFLRTKGTEFRLKLKEDYGLPYVPFFYGKIEEQGENTIIRGEFKLQPFFNFMVTGLQGVLAIIAAAIIAFAIILIWGYSADLFNKLFVSVVAFVLLFVWILIIRWKLRWGRREAERKIEFMIEYCLKGRKID